MKRRFVGPGALVSSIGVHALALGVGGFLISRSFSRVDVERQRAESAEVAVELSPQAVPTPDVAGDQATNSTPRPAPMPKPRRVVTGGGVHEKRPDLDRSGHGGDRRSPEATNLASS